MNNKILLISLIIIILLGTLILFKDKDKLFNNAKIRILTIKSGSMSTTLNINDIIIIKRDNEYKIGDIITYNYKDKYLVTHRIVGKYQNLFITKGDNNNSEDEEYLEGQNVKGKVILVIKKEYLKTTFIIILAIILIKILKRGK